jgi:hypothetical protein
MKIHIIYLDPQDDHASTRDKLNACQAQRAALVWPNRGRILSRRLDLVLIERHARNRGLQIGLVTIDPTIQRNAQSVGIPTFETLDQASQDTWRTKPQGSTVISLEERDRAQIRESLLEGGPRKQQQSAAGPGQWIIGAVALVAVLVLAAALLPSARVVVLPDLESHSLEQEVTFDPEIAAPTSEGVVPARPVSVIVGGELSLSTSAFVFVPTEYASGVVEFTNLTSDTITIPSGTGVRTSGDPAIRFETNETAVLPAGPDTTTEASVRALEPGQSGNVDVGSIIAVEGLLGLEISVRNPRVTSGGLDHLNPSVSEADLLRLWEDLTEILLAEAKSELETGLGEDRVLVTESLAVSRVIHEQFDHAAGDAAETVGLSMELEVSGLVYEWEDLEDLLQQGMQDRRSVEMQGVPGSLAAVQQGDGQIGSDGLITITFLATQLMYEEIDLDTLAYQLPWRTSQQAIGIIEDQDSLSVQEISIFPEWFPRLPLLALRIDVLWDWENP